MELNLGKSTEHREGDLSSIIIITSMGSTKQWGRDTRCGKTLLITYTDYTESISWNHQSWIMDKSGNVIT